MRVEKIEVPESQLRHFLHEGLITFEWPLPDEIKALIKKESATRDLFRSHEILYKFLTHKNFGAFAFQLADTKPLRLLMDLSHVVREQLNIQRLSFQGISLGICFHLETDTVTFFNPDTRIDLGIHDYLVVLGTNTSLYVPHEEDSGRNYCKNLGLAFGDRLQNTDFPIIHK